MAQDKLSLAASLISGFRNSSQLEAAISRLSNAESAQLLYDWRTWARPEQLPPGSPGAANPRTNWRYWLCNAGRGWGKSKTGAETVRMWARDPKERILLVGPTADDVRSVMIDGPSGLMSCYPPGHKPNYNPSLRLINFPSGAIGITRSAEEPERLRGPQFSKFWIDEACAFTKLTEAWQQLTFGFRMRTTLPLKGVITTTPKPIKWLRDMVANPGTVVTGGSSYENYANIAEEYYQEVIAPYEGTRLGRQEIYAEILEDIPGALWTRGLIEAHRINMNEVPEPQRLVIGVDPAVTSGEKSNRTGIIAVSMSYWRGTTHAFVLDDLSLRGSPGEWARVVVEAFRRWRADCVIAEVNQGGDLVEGNIVGYDPRFFVPVRKVRAKRGKAIRAEPVARLYEQGRVHHVRQANLEHLEDEQCQFVPGIETELEDSPDRMDALVWAITDLMIDPEPTGAVVIGRA